MSDHHDKGSHIIRNGSLSEIAAYVGSVVDADDWRERLSSLQTTLPGDTYSDVIVPRLVARAFILRGPEGATALMDFLVDPGSRGLPVRSSWAALEALWYACEGGLADRFVLHSIPDGSPLHRELPEGSQPAAQQAIRRVVAESLEQEELFDALIHFTMQATNLRAADGESHLSLRRGFMKAFAETGIRIKQSAIEEFQLLLEHEHVEERYQAHLKKYPVLLDPLAAEVVDKHRLGSDLITDFVIRRHDGLYILVEIERPSCKLFTKSGDFTTHFTHALGQVLDFQQWVDDHSEYAKARLPGITSPRGLLVVGRSSEITTTTHSKWVRLKRNLSTIDIMTFDELVARAETLHRSLHGLEARNDSQPNPSSKLAPALRASASR